MTASSAPLLRAFEGLVTLGRKLVEISEMAFGLLRKPEIGLRQSSSTRPLGPDDLVRRGASGSKKPTLKAPINEDSDWEYVGQVLGTLCAMSICVDCVPVVSRVEHVRANFWRVTLEPRYTVYLDDKLRVVDDPGDVLPSDFSGLLSARHKYRVIWRDGDGNGFSVEVIAASRRFARLFARAPANAYIEVQ